MSFRMTIGVLVIGSIVSPVIFISINIPSSFSRKFAPQ
jgi:hypothetical protein